MVETMTMEMHMQLVLSIVGGGVAMTTFGCCQVERAANILMEMTIEPRYDL